MPDGRFHYEIETLVGSLDEPAPSQGPIHARHDAGGDVFNLRGNAGARRVLDEEIHIDGKIAHDFLETCLGLVLNPWP